MNLVCVSPAIVGRPFHDKMALGSPEIQVSLGTLHLVGLHLDPQAPRPPMAGARSSVLYRSGFGQHLPRLGRRRNTRRWVSSDNATFPSLRTTSWSGVCIPGAAVPQPGHLDSEESSGSPGPTGLITRLQRAAGRTLTGSWNMHSSISIADGPAGSTPWNFKQKSKHKHG